MKQKSEEITKPKMLFQVRNELAPKEVDDILSMFTDTEKKEYESLLLLSLRETGRTTRLVDKYIQEIMGGGEVMVIDHEKPTLNNTLIVRIFENRLKHEHPWFKYTKRYEGGEPIYKKDNQ